MTKLQFIIQATNRVTLISDELKEYYTQSKDESKFSNHVFQYIFKMHEINDLLKGQNFMDETLKNEYLDIIKEILKELHIIEEGQENENKK